MQHKADSSAKCMLAIKQISKANKRRKTHGDGGHCLDILITKPICYGPSAFAGENAFPNK